MHTVNTIVLALDGSDAAKRAIPFAVGLARESGSEIVIVHVDERMGTRGQAPIDIEEEKIRAEIQTLVKELAAQGIEARLEIVEMVSRGAEIAQAIADIAGRSKADLIVHRDPRPFRDGGAVRGQRHPAAAPCRNAARSDGSGSLISHSDRWRVVPA